MTLLKHWSSPTGGRPLADVDLPREGHRIGVGEDEIHALIDVESAGRGFDDVGRVRMLFEPHIFYRELGAGPARDEAVRLGLAYKSWKPGAYPRDSYPRLERAIALCDRHGRGWEPALRACSWGLGQIMGFNCKLAGYPTAYEMVCAFRESEGIQLRGMVDFVKNTGLDDELRRHDWHGLARGYNGAGYRKNGYHTKLAASYARWSKIKDTPWSPETDAHFGRDSQRGHDFSALETLWEVILRLFEPKGAHA